MNEPDDKLAEDPNAYLDPRDMPPADFYDPVIEAYKKDVDRTLLRENLKLTPQERSEKFMSFMKCVYELRKAGERARQENPEWGLR